ncbi:MAG: beta strand repeat-containing protein [Candidatus Saccharimonadales bacterium]
MPSTTTGTVTVTFTSATAYSVTGLGSTYTGQNAANVGINLQSGTATYALVINGGNYTISTPLTVQTNDLTLTAPSTTGPISLTNRAYVQIDAVGVNTFTPSTYGVTGTIGAPTGTSVKITSSTGGTINANAASNSMGAGIGGGQGQTAGTITFSGNVIVNASGGSTPGAGIGGGGAQNQLYTINQNGVSWVGGGGGTIIIEENATVTASANSAAAIGGGNSFRSIYGSTSTSDTINNSTFSGGAGAALTMRGNAKLRAVTGIVGGSNAWGGCYSCTLVNGTGNKRIGGSAGSVSIEGNAVVIIANMRSGSSGSSWPGTATGTVTEGAGVTARISGGFTVVSGYLAGATAPVISGGSLYVANISNMTPSPVNASSALVYPMYVPASLRGTTITVPGLYSTNTLSNDSVISVFVGTAIPTAQLSAVLWAPAASSGTKYTSISAGSVTNAYADMRQNYAAYNSNTETNWVRVASISSVSPALGYTTGGASIVISGEGFGASDLASTSTVRLGTAGSGYSTCTVTSWSTTAIYCTTTAHAAGIVDVNIYNSLYNITASGAFTYYPPIGTITVSPNYGPVTGGTTIVLTGSNIGTQAQTTVTLDQYGTPATCTNVTILTSNSLSCKTSQHLEGTFGVYVYNGIDITAASDMFTYVETSLSLASNGQVSAQFTPGSGVSSVEDVVNVMTNNPNGYRLLISAMSDNAEDRALRKDGTSSTYKISPASSSSLNVNEWGVSLSNGINSWLDVPFLSSPRVLKTTSTATSISGEDTSIWYGTKVDMSLPAGTYSGRVLLTAVANS